MQTATLDTNVLPAEDLIGEGQEQGISFAVVSVTERETEHSRYQVHLKPLDQVPETMVWGESRWGQSAWGSKSTASALERILEIISNGAFPRKQGNLSPGQLRQLRDAMIFEAHINARRDVFVTDDRRAFIDRGRREKLESAFTTKILTKDELLQLFSRRGTPS